MVQRRKPEGSGRSFPKIGEQRAPQGIGRYPQRFSETPKEIQLPTQRGPETLQQVRQRLVKEALAVDRARLNLPVSGAKPTPGKKAMKFKVYGKLRK